jgi:hypothetical protein
MGLLDEAGLERRVAAGCEACGSKRLTFRAFVDGMLPIMGGEPIGSVSWVYDGEKAELLRQPEGVPLVVLRTPTLLHAHHDDFVRMGRQDLE